MILPTSAEERKATPIFSGVLQYFPLALAEVAKVSVAGHAQHNDPSEPLKWNKQASADHTDCLIRHLIDSGTTDNDGIRHSAKVAWRALAHLQTELEAQQPDPEKACPVSFVASQLPSSQICPIKLREAADFCRDQIFPEDSDTIETNASEVLDALEEDLNSSTQRMIKLFERRLFNLPKACPAPPKKSQ